jgi:hypothetical protein
LVDVCDLLGRQRSGVASDAARVRVRYTIPSVRRFRLIERGSDDKVGRPSTKGESVADVADTANFERFGQDSRGVEVQQADRLVELAVAEEECARGSKDEIAVECGSVDEGSVSLIRNMIGLIESIIDSAMLTCIYLVWNQ